MSKTIVKEIPLSEITLRRYEKPGKLSERELIRKVCLSLGLLQPGDSRDSVVDVFLVLVKASQHKKGLMSEEVEQHVIAMRKKHKQPLLGIAGSNVRRQLKRLKELFLIEKVANKYRITEHEKLHDIFEEKIKQFYLEPISKRVSEYLSLVK